MIFKTDDRFPGICVESCAETSPNVFSCVLTPAISKIVCHEPKSWVPVKAVMSAFFHLNFIKNSGKFWIYCHFFKISLGHPPKHFFPRSEWWSDCSWSLCSTLSPPLPHPLNISIVAKLYFVFTECITPQISLMWHVACATVPSLCPWFQPGHQPFSSHRGSCLHCRAAVAAQEQLLSCHKLEAGVLREIEMDPGFLQTWVVKELHVLLSYPWSKR